MKTFTPRIDTPRTNAAVAECATPPDPHFIDFVLGLERESKAVQGQRDAFRDEVERLKTARQQIATLDLKSEPAKRERARLLAVISAQEDKAKKV